MVKSSSRKTPAPQRKGSATWGMMPKGLLVLVPTLSVSCGISYHTGGVILSDPADSHWSCCVIDSWKCLKLDLQIRMWLMNLSSRSGRARDWLVPMIPHCLWRALESFICCLEAARHCLKWHSCGTSSLTRSNSWFEFYRKAYDRKTLTVLHEISSVQIDWCHSSAREACGRLTMGKVVVPPGSEMELMGKQLGSFHCWEWCVQSTWSDSGPVVWFLYVCSTPEMKRDVLWWKEWEWQRRSLWTRTALWTL